MIVVLASCHDTAAQTLVEQHRDSDVCMMTPDDLSRAGWRHQLADLENGAAVAAGETLPSRTLAGVLARLPWVAEYELPQIVPADRAYVAAEMNAFLLSWLTELTCPVLNRPTPQCLSGPFWRREKWVQTASRLGIPVAAVHRQVRFSGSPVLTTDTGSGGACVTIVGPTHVGAVDRELVEQARALARSARVELLVVQFSHAARGAVLENVGLWPDITDSAVADAILKRFVEPAAVADDDARHA